MQAVTTLGIGAAAAHAHTPIHSRTLRCRHRGNTTLHARALVLVRLPAVTVLPSYKANEYSPYKRDDGLISKPFYYCVAKWDVAQESEITKQQLSWRPDLALLGCCLVCFSPFPVRHRIQSPSIRSSDSDMWSKLLSCSELGSYEIKVIGRFWKTKPRAGGSCGSWIPFINWQFSDHFHWNLICNLLLRFLKHNKAAWKTILLPRICPILALEPMTSWSIDHQTSMLAWMTHKIMNCNCYPICDKRKGKGCLFCKQM